MLRQWLTPSDIPLNRLSDGIGLRYLHVGISTQRNGNQGRQKENLRRSTARLALSLPPVGRVILVVAEVVLLLHFLNPSIDGFSQVAD